jgi:hypothetical protein
MFPPEIRIWGLVVLNAHVAKVAVSVVDSPGQRVTSLSLAILAGLRVAR